MTNEKEVSESAATRGGLLNGAAAIVGTALSFLLVFVISRHYGAESTGVFFGAVAAFMIVATAMKLGVETAFVFLIAQLRSRGAEAHIPSVLRSGLVPVLGASVLAAAALYDLAPRLAELFTETAQVDDFAAVLRVLSLFVPAWSVSLSLLGATRGSGTMMPTAIGLQLVQPALQIVGAIVAVLAGWDLQALAWCWALPLLVTTAIAATALARRIDRTGHIHETDEQPGLRSELWAFAAPRGVAGTLQMALDRVGILIVGALAPAAVAGQWAAITRLIGLAQRVFHSIGQALNPRLSALAERQDWAGVTAVVARITQWTVLVLSPALLGLVVFPRSALSLFGSDFADGAPGLVVAAIAVGAATLFAHADNVLLMAGRSRVAMINTAIALVVSVGLYLALVPVLDLVGAALALAGGTAVYRLTAARQISQWFGVASFGAAAVRAIVVAVVTVGIPMIAARLLWGDELLAGIGAGIVGLGAYGAAVVSLRERAGFSLSLSE